MLLSRPYTKACGLLYLILAGCSGGSGVMPQGDLAGGADGGPDLSGAMCAPFTGDVASCRCSPDEYAPRYMGSRLDTWPACASDDNMYRLFGMSTPSAAARTRAFDSMGLKLWKNPNAPTAMNFTEARAEYAIAEGIQSRVQRRQDIHYPEVPGMDKFACNDMAVAAMHPDRCAGPARLQPILNDAFQKGQAGTQPRVQAARIEAALLWFFYLSTLSEVWTSSFNNAGDIDSSIGYYTSTLQRAQVDGPAAYIKALHQETHDRVFDGLLAGRCWRDIDKALPTARMDLYKRALDQLDRALTRGMALILRDRLGKLQGIPGEVQQAHLAFISTLGGFLDRAARATDPARADMLKAQVMASTPNILQAQQLIDALFPCP